MLGDGPREVDPLTVELDNNEQFDEVLNGKDTLPFGSGIKVVTKDNGTESGRAVANLSFLVQLPDGSVKRAQITTTVKILNMLNSVLRGRYDDDGFSRFKQDGN